MFNKNVFQTRCSKGESGNVVIIVLVVLVVIAVGALTYMSGQRNGEQQQETSIAELKEQSVDKKQPPSFEIKPGNPVVAKVCDKEISRLDVFNYIQTLPANTRQMPIEQLFSVAMEQIINSTVINKKTEDVNLDNDPEVKKQLAVVKNNIVRNVYIQNKVTKRITDERLKEAYDMYKLQFPEVEEVKASHILVKEEKLAKDIIKQLNDGDDFAALAKKNSTDGTAVNGGVLGYFAKADVVPPFAEAAFSTEIGTYTSEPVKSKFGYHVIKVEEKRIRLPAQFKDVKTLLETQLRQFMLNQIVKEWRDEFKIERFDINGDEIKPVDNAVE